MKKGTIGLIAGLAGLLILVGGFSVASNMGFKFVPNIPADTYFNLGLPWNQNFTVAHELFNDLIGQGGGVEKVTKIANTGGVIDWYAGAQPDADYAIAKGEAFVVKTAAGGSGMTTAVVVGSHDPNFTFSFTGGEYFNAAAPYHQTLTTASALFSDMNTQLSGKIEKITKITDTGGVIDWYSGAQPDANFALDLGMGVVVYANDNAAGYVWPHY